jgi:hypothetical protein
MLKLVFMNGFVGIGDQMKCFCCDGCLENWTASDNVGASMPSTFRSVNFLRLQKDQSMWLTFRVH